MGLPEGGKPTGKVGNRENKLLPVQYTLITISAQVLEWFIYTSVERSLKVE